MPAIRRHVNIATTPRKVWAAITTSDGLTSWLLDDARVDARSGGRIMWEHEGFDGEPVQGHGTIHKIRPTSTLEITWDRGGDFPAQGCRLQFRVSRDGDETRLALVLSGPTLDDPELREALDKEWGRDLRALQSSLDAD